MRDACVYERNSLSRSWLGALKVLQLRRRQLKVHSSLSQPYSMFQGLPRRQIPKAASTFRHFIELRFRSNDYKTQAEPPWKLAHVRPGVCYIGLVFKMIPNDPQQHACCAAQMFLNEGDAVVFRGANGPWKTGDYEFHLKAPEAKRLIAKVLETFTDKHGEPPKEFLSTDERLSARTNGMPSRRPRRRAQMSSESALRRLVASQNCFVTAIIL